MSFAVLLVLTACSGSGTCGTGGSATLYIFMILFSSRIIVAFR